MTPSEPVNNKSMQHEYRDTDQQELDAHHRRQVVLRAAGHALGHRDVSDVFYDLVEGLDLWDELVDLLRKRQYADDHRVELVEAERARRAAIETSVTEQ